ncbi:ergosterol biosynthesis ERG4/ERG24 [Aspergillus pseudoustus]|uniref:Delta(24(24(1)))-sterol reductase n=1 Tax=Aspergillus pseudoustus TaxID=1810923 RepID=A0ABR4J0A9_9EURO
MSSSVSGRSPEPRSRHVNGKPSSSPVEPSSASAEQHYEFGGPLGVTCLMLGFPLLMYYMFLGATVYNGSPPLPSESQSVPEFLSYLYNLAYTHAYPHKRAWAIYWTFLLLEGGAYYALPGVYRKGKPLPHLNGEQLPYYCSAISSWYATILGALALHFTGLFRLDALITDFGPLMSVAILSGYIVSILAYASALARGAQHRMTGNHVYDFFMGAELNPRLFKWIDMKMFFEVRIPWFILFLLTLATALKQFEELGYVAGEVWFLLLAHFLYANACSKAEDLIIPTWDMYYEKWGFMLIFWNLAGVPMSYCHCTLYLANHHPSEYRWNPVILAVWAVAYLFVYWVWDTCNSQKNIFRAEEKGGTVLRKTFPQLPWRKVVNPRKIEAADGSLILCDGWYGLARKTHYTCDWFFAVSWGLITGFNSPFPWFYSVFFTVMIIHRARRDIHRCRERYGEAWKEYERRVPYLFIPVSLRLSVC